MTVRVHLSQCQRTLVILWYAGSLLGLGVAMAQTLLAQDKTHEAAVSAWLPSLMPTLLMVTGVVAADAMQEEQRTQTVDRFFFRLTVMLSAFYLLLVNGVIFYQPLSDLSPLGLAHRANLFLSPFQGLVSAALGVFFTSRRKDPGAGS